MGSRKGFLKRAYRKERVSVRTGGGRGPFCEGGKKQEKMLELKGEARVPGLQKSGPQQRPPSSTEPWENSPSLFKVEENLLLGD